MKGKIFPESSNIHQDQAKILFNYYQQAAEKIVNEEERIESEIAKLNAEKKVVEESMSTGWKRFVLWISFKLKKTKAEVESLVSRISEFEKMKTEIFRDYKVSKLGVAYVPVADQIKYDNKSFIVDYTGLVQESEVKLQMSKQNDLLIETIADLEKLSESAPIVETSKDIEELETEQYSKSIQNINQHDYFGKLERSLRTISFCMDDLDVTSVQLPLVANESEYLNFLKEYATNELPDNAVVIGAFDTAKYNDQISKFQELNKLKDSLSRHTAQFEDVLKGLMMTMANSVQAISALKIASADKVIFESNKVLYKMLKSPYNHYSPILEASEIERIKNETFNYGDSVVDYVPFELKESSKVKFNLVGDIWTAEDGSTTNFPFGVHQIHEEIVAPMVQNLMNETRIERLKIYNHIKDQKISYLNKWHQDTEDFYGRNRAESADLINLMRASLRDYVAAFNTLASLKNTEDSMSQSGGSLDSTVVATTNNSEEVFAAFELQSKEFQNVQLDFENYMELLKEDIDYKASEFEHIDYYDALLRDGNPKEIAVAADEVHGMDSRRKPLITVNPLFAKSSELPPVPSMESLTDEHMALNLPSIAKNTLRELEEDLIPETVETIQEDEETVIGDDILDGDVIEDETSDDDEISEEGVENTEFEDSSEEDSSEGDLVEDLEVEEKEMEESDDSDNELFDEEESIEDFSAEDTLDDDSEDQLSDEEDTSEDWGADDNDDSDDDGDDDEDDDDEDDDDGGDDDGGDDDGGDDTPPAGNDSVADDLKSKFSGLMDKTKGFGGLKGKFGI
jgi:hypothetical protein